MRSFLALVPPQEVLDTLEELLEPRRDSGPDLRWTDPQQWHVTLAFLDDVPAAVLEKVIGSVGAVAARTAALDLHVGGIGAFPDVARGRVLWTGVEDVPPGSGRLTDLAAHVRTACARVGAPPEGQRFRGHLTLARSGRPQNLSRWVRALSGYAGCPWRADRLTLLASHLGQGRGGRPRYETLHEWRLEP